MKSEYIKVQEERELTALGSGSGAQVLPRHILANLGANWIRK